ncbi:D-alanyl-D-alanine carboxypeptidase [Thermoleophilia bacterium SCSIO 60948]|nr:D-alanyl-D-alanine carboxypeptidase [Thermoleophilia bacterium SCSIO 60948]
MSDRGRPAARRALPSALATVLLTLLASLVIAHPVAAQRTGGPDPQLDAASWILLDTADDTVLASRRADERRGMASTTKLITAYVARRDLELSDVVVAPPYQAGPIESLMNLETGERISVDDLLHGLLMVSGNDAAEALAVAAAGSTPSFVGEMNAAADELGLDDTSYENPIGFDAPTHYTTAADLAELAETVLADPFLRRVVGTRQITLRGGERTRRLRNSNELLQSTSWVTGVKTGYTEQSGYVLVSSGSRRGADLLAVVMGAPSEEARDASSLELLEYGFSLYGRETAIESGERLARATVELKDQRVQLESDADVKVSAREDQEVDVVVDAPSEVEAPIEQGQKLGTATVELDGEVVDRVALRAVAAVAAPTLLERIDGFVVGPRIVVWLLALLVLGLIVALIAIAGRQSRR